MKKIATIVALLAFVFSLGAPVVSEAVPLWRFAWSRYTGWEIWGYMAKSGIMKKWADKYGVNISLEYVDDYANSIQFYTQGTYHGVAITNMDALTGPAVGGVKTTGLIFGDYSNGNDGVVLLNGTSCQDLVGRKVKIVEFSVSHYLLARCLEKSGVAEKDLKLENTSEQQIVAIFKRAKDPLKAVVTWNPYLMEVRYEKNTTMVFDSSKISGEIIDMMAVRNDVPDNVKKALVGAWYEAMEIMASNEKKGMDARKWMAKQAGGTLDQFEQQLKTTFMFYKPADAVAFARDEELKVTMERVRQFAFSHGLLTGAKDVDMVGIQLPDGAIVGNPDNVTLLFDASYMEMAARGEL